MMRVVRLALLCFTLALAGCGSSSRPEPLGRSDPAPHVPASLPAQGLVVSGRRGVELLGLDGGVLGALAGFRLDPRFPPGYSQSRRVLIRDARGREYALGAVGLSRTSRPRPRGYGCHVADPPYSVCFLPRRASVVKRDGRTVVGSANRRHPEIGHWVSARLSPDHRTLLLQWSAECEVPVAYFANVDGSRLRPVAKDPSGPAVSSALGWARDGRAVVLVAATPCGGTLSGIYLVDPESGRRTLVYRTSRPAALWG